MRGRARRRRHRHRAGGRIRGAALRRVLLRKPAMALLVLVAAATAVTVGGSSSREVQTAADLSQFTAGNIISDQVFFFGGAMTASGVQSFIDDKNRSCVTGYDGTPCLRAFRQDTTTRAADGFCNGYAGAPQESAATIITKVAVSCDVSPKVLLVMLQKEQALMSASGANLYAGRYRSAMGYGCPDTGAGCDAAYYGFQNQVYNAARQFQRYKANPANWVYRAGRTVNILYSPNTACGSSPVAIANQATAGLYNYTPYQPNAAALQAGYGAGDSCSAYGNRNFWEYFTDWFSSTQVDVTLASSPKGWVDSLQVTTTGFTASGWTYDPDTTAPVTVRATVDGALVAVTSTSFARPDVAAAFDVGPNTGFAISGLLGYGTHQVCIVADNASGPGVSTELNCQTVTFTNRPPQAVIDHFTEQADGTVALSGWAFDPDGTQARIDVYVNGKPSSYLPGVARSDVQAVFPAAGPNSGYAVTLGPLAAGSHVCVYAVDTVALGNNWLLQCQSFPYRAPAGSLDSVAEDTAGQVHLWGWALDPSTPQTPVAVPITVDGTVAARPQASDTRDDVGSTFPTAGAAHGFDATLALALGKHQVCVDAVNTGVAGPNTALGCRTLTLQYVSPLGNLETVRNIGGGQVSVGGWAWDASVPDASLRVDFYSDGHPVGVTQAAGNRPDVAAAFPGAGPAHGYTSTLTVGSGRHQVCAYAINVGVPGANPLIGCSTVDMADVAPIGSVDYLATTGPGQVTLWGWAFDPDAPTASASVRVLVDGVDRGLLVANGPRPDVGAAYPSAGAAHGFGTSLTVSAGQHDVCVSALSTAGQASPASLRCARVTA